MGSSLFRIVRVAGLSAGAAVLYGFFRSARSKPAATEATGDAQWEPLTTPEPVPTRSGPVTFADAGTQSTPDAAATTPSSWIEPARDGSCPPDWPIKGNDGSKIFHVPGGMSYERTVAERCYQAEADAEADGYRKAKR